MPRTINQIRHNIRFVERARGKPKLTPLQRKLIEVMYHQLQHELQLALLQRKKTK